VAHVAKSRIARPRHVAALLVVLACTTPAPAAGDPGPRPSATARAAWTEGRKLFAQGLFLRAAETFDTAYESSAMPCFLLDAAVAYDRAGEVERAVERYRSAEAAVRSAPVRTRARSRREALESRAARVDPPPTEARSPGRDAPVVAPPAPVLRAEAATFATAPSPAPRGRAHAALWWGAGAALLAAALTGVAVAWHAHGDRGCGDLLCSHE